MNPGTTSTPFRTGWQHSEEVGDRWAHRSQTSVLDQTGIQDKMALDWAHPLSGPCFHLNPRQGDVIGRLVKAGSKVVLLLASPLQNWRGPHGLTWRRHHRPCASLGMRTLADNGFLAREAQKSLAHPSITREKYSFFCNIGPVHHVSHQGRYLHEHLQNLLMEKEKLLCCRCLPSLPVQYICKSVAAGQRKRTGSQCRLGTDSVQAGGGVRDTDTWSDEIEGRRRDMHGLTPVRNYGVKARGRQAANMHLGLADVDTKRMHPSVPAKGPKPKPLASCGLAQKTSPCRS
ncbi:hypothetical protein ACLOJK_039911 [Asimina triloba]